MAEERPVYRGSLPEERSFEGVPILGGLEALASSFTPIEREVIREPEVQYYEDMGRRYVDKVIPGEYGEPEFGMPAAVQGILDFAGFLKDDPKGAASAIGEGIASIPEEQAQGAFALMQGADYAYDPETGETSTFDPLLLPATTALGTAASIARVADDGSTVLGIMGGRMAKDGPSKFSEARAARRTKSDQEVFEETGAYFDGEVFPDESDAFRFEIPTRESELVGIEDVVRKSNDSSAGPGPRNYFYMDDKTNVTGLKKDVVGINILDNGGFSVESQFKNAAGEMEPAKYPRLSEVLDFPELYEQYPQLKDVYVARLMNSEASGAQAVSIEKGIQDRPTIALGYAISPRLFQSHLLHEVQHAVQKIEDFPRGGAPIGMSEKDYERLYGEVEARNVESRFMSELDDIPQTVPTQTRDTAPADMLLDDGKPAVELSRLTGLSPDEMGEKIGGVLINPQNEPGRFFISDLGGSEVTLKPSVDLMGEVRPNTIEIDVLFGKPRRQGHGSEILNRINRLADETGTTMRLFPTPIESPGQPTIRLDDLVDFYKSKGFEFEDPDPSITELDRYMIRVPRKAEGGVMGMVDLARNAGRGPRGVESLVPVARNMNRSMLG